ncbi:GNAT family N-acetyltransferase [Acinetobacter larvae]|uniref:GNAT family N-acetyltransferase n=1 Tax=Acinetobacter larvae TaxID=1789224 RepID=A0A1B2LX84_9GAMM|nr:GNAT family N-acetyltransferase [Acinetobacter larvae]AOA57572.1 GNAT family N-acetyltransferase [Acinetobacter larvae]
MKLRTAGLADLPHLIEMAQDFIKEAPNYRKRTLVVGALENNLKSIVESGAIFVVELHKNIVGGIVCATTKDWFNDDLIAFEQVFYVKPKYRATRAPLLLIDALIEWSHGMNASRIQCGTTTGIQTKGCLRLYERFGFREFGQLFDMELDR